MRSLPSLLCSRWDTDPPRIGAGEIARSWADEFERWQRAGLVRALAPAGSSDCPDCSRRGRVETLIAADGRRRCFVRCDDCGLAEVATDTLRLWELATEPLLATLFVDTRLAIRRHAAPQVWRIGSATWGGRVRQLWFVRALRRGVPREALEPLRSTSRPVVFAPTTAGAARWQTALGQPVIPLEEVLAPGELALTLALDEIEGRLFDADPVPATRARPRPRKRATRLADIEQLRGALIAHLRSARDHALSTCAESGGPRLLPRPSQKQLGELLGLSESRVSRCLNDRQASELRLYWETAQDLDRILRFQGAVSSGRRA